MEIGGGRRLIRKNGGRGLLKLYCVKYVGGVQNVLPVKKGLPVY